MTFQHCVRILKYLLVTTSLLSGISCNGNPYGKRNSVKNVLDDSIPRRDVAEVTGGPFSWTGAARFDDLIRQFINGKFERKASCTTSTTASTLPFKSSASRKSNDQVFRFLQSGQSRPAVDEREDNKLTKDADHRPQPPPERDQADHSPQPPPERDQADHRPQPSPKREFATGLVSGICLFNCSHEEVILRKTLQPVLLLQLSVYLHARDLTLVTHEENKDRCFSIGRSLFMRGIRATCTTFQRLGGYYPALVLIASDQDEGKRISEELQKLGEQITSDELTVSDIAVVLFSPTMILQPPNARMHYCAVQTKHGGNIEVKEVFTFGPDSQIPAEEVMARWTLNNGVTNSPFTRGHFLAPKDFMGNVVRVTYAESYPDIFEDRDTFNKTEVKGYSADIIDLLQKKLNFTVRWIRAPDNEFGVLLDNGSFTGVVGVLQRKEADIGVPGLNINAERSRFIEFSPAVDFGELRLLIFKSPKLEAIQWSTYFGGFQWHVWLALVFVWLTMSVGIVVVSRPDPDISVYNYLFIFLGAIAQQGSPIEPSCGRGRVVFLSFWAGSLILYTSYTASLTSQLTWVYSEDPFTTLGGALTKAGYSVIIRSGTGYISSVKEIRSKDKYMDILYRQWMARPELLVKDDNEAVLLLQSTKEKYAYLKFNREVNPYMRDNCSYTWVGQSYFPEYTHFGYAKNLSYANVISQSITQATDAGILSKLSLKWWGKEATCMKSGFQHLGFSKTASAFALLFAGGVLAVVFHVGEVLSHRCCLSRRGNASDGLDSKRRKRMTRTTNGQYPWRTIEVTPYEPHLKARFPH